MEWSINNRNVIVTGGSSGIGKAVAAALSSQGARVAITSRSESRGHAAVDDIQRVGGHPVELLIVDFADLESVRVASKTYLGSHDELVVLVNNAGVVKGSASVSVDGHETTFATNHLGPFLFTSMLLELLRHSQPSRILNTSSVAHTYAKEGIMFDDLGFERRRYRFMEVYGHSKLANILHTREINERLSSDGVTAAAIHPGVVRTGFGRGGDAWLVGLAERFGGRWMRSPEDGADTIVWLATTPEIDPSDGCYFEDRKPQKSSRHARSADQAKRLWEISERITAGTET